jgi:hypothetical protein
MLLLGSGCGAPPDTIETAPVAANATALSPQECWENLMECQADAQLIKLEAYGFCERNPYPDCISQADEIVNELLRNCLRLYQLCNAANNPSTNMVPATMSLPNPPPILVAGGAIIVIGGVCYALGAPVTVPATACVLILGICFYPTQCGAEEVPSSSGGAGSGGDPGAAGASGNPMSGSPPSGSSGGASHGDPHSPCSGQTCMDNRDCERDKVCHATDAGSPVIGCCI